MDVSNQLLDDSAVPQLARLYVRGVNRHTTAESLRAHFSSIGEVKRVELSENPRQGFGWVSYQDVNTALTAIRELHHSNLNGSVISVRFEIGTGREPSQPKVVNSTCIPRHIRDTAPAAPSKKQRKGGDANVSYVGKGILVNGTEYPTTQGVYLMKLLNLCKSSMIGNRQPLVDALLGARHGNMQAKELSESMAMVNAVEKLGHMCGLDWKNNENVNVYVLADGLMPSTSIAMCLFYPLWKFTSIDPIMNYDPAELGDFSSKISCVRSMSQDFKLDGTESQSSRNSLTTADDRSAAAQYLPCFITGEALAPGDQSYSSIKWAALSASVLSRGPINIVIACHSHAPLQEFWDRVPAPKFCVSMPCCGKLWSHLDQAPVAVYDDYEVFSPKRKIYLYRS